ncbi:DUF3088 family protein [Kiloniella antarctica]|uniref:DUF3088 family protein n=1 Tax=Kiloniella antarctica TaxID=1550907 RepID=A0ABW5BJ26_9PROT
MKPILFVLKMPFDDNSVPSTDNTSWFCSHCALIEGALAVNPDWNKHIEVRRIPFTKPREQIIELLGEENQWLPVLIINKTITFTDPIEITSYLAKTYGGAAPHP